MAKVELIKEGLRVTSGWIIFCEISLVLGFALVFGIREIVNLRRFVRKRAAKAEGEKAPTRSDAAS